VQSEDYYPTLLAGLGLPAAPGQKFDGVSILPALQGQPFAREAIFTYFPHAPGVPDWLPPAVAVHQGDWKLIRIFFGGANGAHRWQLFNLREDLGEKNDLAAKEPARVKALDALIEKFLSDTQAVTPVRNPAFNPAAYPRADEGKQKNDTKKKAKTKQAKS
jgi:arylsulfatase A-like enzyme